MELSATVATQWKCTTLSNVRADVRKRHSSSATHVVHFEQKCSMLSQMSEEFWKKYALNFPLSFFNAAELSGVE